MMLKIYKPIKNKENPMKKIIKKPSLAKLLIPTQPEKEVERILGGRFQTQPNPDYDIIGEVYGGE